jgi:hypothetical protein
VARFRDGSSRTLVENYAPGSLAEWRAEGLLLGSLPLHRCGAPGAVNIMANWQDNSIAEYRSVSTSLIFD